MKKLFSIFIAVFVLCAIAAPTSILSASSRAGKNPPATVSERIKYLFENSPYVVTVYAQIAPGMAFEGTGFAYRGENDSGKGFIITNDHVLGQLGNRIAWIRFDRDDIYYTVNIVGRDPALDVAILEIPADYPKPIAYASVNFAASVAVGDEVYAVGYPLRNREVTVGWVNSPTSGLGHWFFSSQAPIYVGNSGGPLVRFTKSGFEEVIGINTAMLEVGTKIGSIPIGYVGKVLPRLMREGIVEHAALWLAFHDTKDIPPPLFEDDFFLKNRSPLFSKPGVMMAGLNMPYPPLEPGVMIVVPAERGEGEASRLTQFKSGDVIKQVMFQGVDVPFTSARELREYIFFELRPGDVITLFIERGGEPLVTPVVLGAVDISEEGY